MLIFIIQLAVVNATPEPTIDFNRDIAQLISKRCLECHNQRDVKGNVNLTAAKEFRIGTENGKLALKLINEGKMPPESKGVSSKLPDEEIKLFTDWVLDGSPWPKGRVLDLYETTTDVRAGRDWWSLQPIKRPDPTNPRMNPIDSFIRQKLKDKSLTPANNITYTHNKMRV